MHYRQEIDGLRAIAVLPVLFFHSGLEIANGGFIGVDIFFVISGYLITTIIIEKLDNANFSLLEFYFRRAKRILPALFVVVIVCIPISWLTMSPSQLKDFMQSVVAVSLFSSNILFLHESGYFATTAEIKPLLHTWSLAVEEQFYFIFPLLLLMIGFGNNKRKFVFALMVVASLFSAWYVATYSKDASFYLLPTRAWELLIGSLCAVILNAKSGRENNILAFVGLICILMPMMFYELGADTLIYRFSAVIGVGLIILYAPVTTVVGRILSFNPLVIIGLMSYSIYLWHQPIFAFTRLYHIGPISAAHWGGLIILTLGIAYLSWRYVEQPCRHQRFLSNGNIKQFFPYISVSIVLLVIGLQGHFNNGFESRFDGKVLHLLAAEQDKNPNRQYCHHFSTVTNLNKEKCTFFGENANRNVLFWGDSHADSIAWELAQELSKIGVATTTFSYGGCPPVQDISLARAEKNFQCAEFNRLVLEDIKESDYDAIILSARWTLMFSGQFFDNGEGGIESRLPVEYVGQGDEVNEKTGNNQKGLMDHYQRSIKEYLDVTDAKIIVLEPIPEAGWNVPHEISKRYVNNGKVEAVSTNYSVYQQRNGKVIALLNNINHSNYFLVKSNEVLCNTLLLGRCLNNTEKETYYSDDDHLSHAGSTLLAIKIKDKLLDIFNYN